MGMFSWFTSDTQERIVADQTRNIIMTGKDGQIFELRNAYEGYGVFGGKDFFEYLAELNDITPTRDAGIELAFDAGGPNGELDILEKKGFFSPRLLADEKNVRNWDRFDPPVSDPDQGFDLQDEYPDDDDEDYDMGYNDYPEDDYYESVIEVKEAVKVGDLILENDDKIGILKKEGRVQGAALLNVINYDLADLRKLSPRHSNALSNYKDYLAGISIDPLGKFFVYSPAEGASALIQRQMYIDVKTLVDTRFVYTSDPFNMKVLLTQEQL